MSADTVDVEAIGKRWRRAQNTSDPAVYVLACDLRDLLDALARSEAARQEAREALDFEHLYEVFEANLCDGDASGGRMTITMDAHDLCRTLAEIVVESAALDSGHQEGGE